jgi:hypothetical protein
MIRTLRFLLAATLWFTSSSALAQESTTVQLQQGSGSIVTTAPSAASSREVWYQQDLANAETRSRRTRNALIGTSVGFAVGAILGGIGASQCQSFKNANNEDELLCNNAGDVLLPLGGTIAGLSAIGMITSGIMLGVANKRKRDIEKDYRRSVYGRIRLDPSGALRF